MGPDRDPTAARTLWEHGAQPERTGLSWQRTALAAAVVVLLLVRAGGGSTAALVVAVGMITLGYLLTVPTVRYRRTATHLTRQQALPDATPLGALALVAATTGIGAVIVILAD